MAKVYILRGSDNNDTLTGKADTKDFIEGLKGDDLINAVGGNDVISGGLGNDTLVSSNTGDRIQGDKGKEVLRGGIGNDIYYVKDADAVVVEQPNQGYDTVYVEGDGFANKGNIEEVILTEDATTNQLISHPSFPTKMTGNSQDNLLASGSGLSDTLIGGGGNDTLDGGGGEDHFIGGEGTDVFVVRRDGTVHLPDFNPLEDTINLVVYNAAKVVFLNEESPDAIKTHQCVYFQSTGKLWNLGKAIAQFPPQTVLTERNFRPGQVFTIKLKEQGLNWLYSFDASKDKLALDVKLAEIAIREIESFYDKKDGFVYYKNTGTLYFNGDLRLQLPPLINLQEIVI